MSSGRFGSKIALELLRSHQVTFLYSRGSTTPFSISRDLFKEDLSPFEIGRTLYHLSKYKDKYHQIEYRDFNDYLNKFQEEVLHHDILISAAAVSDFITDFNKGKISSSSNLSIQLTRAPKVISLAKKLNPRIKVVGFKLLVNANNKDFELASNKLLKNGADYVICNDLNEIRQGNHSIQIRSNEWVSEKFSSNPEREIFKLIQKIP